MLTGSPETGAKPSRADVACVAGLLLLVLLLFFPVAFLGEGFYFRDLTFNHLLDAFAPGWRATLDGAPVEIRRTNAVFRGVPVPAGSHRVEFVYRPLSVTLGATLTGLALLAATGLLVVRRFAGRQLRTSYPESS